MTDSPRPKLTPSQMAQMEILKLAYNPLYLPKRMVGGSTPPEVEKENREMYAEIEKQRLAIIEKYGVVAEYAQPVIQEIAALKAALDAKECELRRLQGICKHPNISGGLCPDCGASISYRRTIFAV